MNQPRYKITAIYPEQGMIEVSDMVTPKDKDGNRLRAEYVFDDVGEFAVGDWVDVIIRKRA